MSGDLKGFVAPSTDAECELLLDLECSVKARKELIKLAIGYMKSGSPIPTAYWDLIEGILKRDKGVAGAPRKASLIRVGMLVQSFTDQGKTETQAIKMAEAKLNASLKSGIKSTTIRKLFHEYSAAKAEISTEEFAGFRKAKASARLK